MARALDELTEPPERKVEIQKNPYGDSFFHEPSAFAEPSTITRPRSKQAYVERIKAEDLQARGIPTYRNASGGVSPITDDTGTALTAFDTRHNIAYDSAGQPKQISYDESGPPKLSDPFEKLPTRLDPKTGALGKFGPGGIYRYEGHDPGVTADLARKERDKTISRETAFLGRKLTLDEHDLRAGEADQKVLKAELKTAVPMLLDPKYEGADRDTIFGAIDEHFNAQYAAPEANESRGWFGKELSPEADARRKEIDVAKAKAYESATTLFDLNDQLSTLDETVRSTRQEQRVNVETLLAHERGEEGPLDQPATAATPEGVTKQAQLYPPEEEWSRMLGGKDAVTQIQDKVRKAEVPAPAAPAVLAATHDLKDAQAKAEQFKDKDPTLYEQYSNVVAQILHGLTSGVAELGKGSFNEPSWSMIVNPLQQHGLMASWITGAVTGEDPKQLRATAREEWGKLPKETEQLVDERLKDTIGSKIANFAGGIAPYVGAALATKGSSAATPVLMSMFYTSGYQRTYEDAKSRGVDDDHAQAAAVGVGAINAVLAMPLRMVGKAAQAIFGDAAPKVVERAITNAMESGGPAAVGKLLGQLAEQIKAGGPGAAALKEEAVAGINSIIKEINKTGVERLATVAKTAAGHAALGAGVATAENLVKKTYNPEQGTFEHVPEMALGFGVLGTMSAGFKQIADARKAKQALDIIAKKGGGAPPPATPPGLGPGPAPKPPTAPAAPTTPKGRETSRKTATKPEKIAQVREISPTEPAKAEAVKPAPRDIVAAEKAYVERGGHADKLEGQTKLAALRRQYPDESARLEAIQERLAPTPEARVSFAGHHELGLVDAKAHAAATSPTNSLAEPSPAQKQAGNYQKGHVQVSGLDISIENPSGSKRKPEYRPLESHYGYIRGTVGADKDHVDIFVKKETPADWDGPVFVVNQVNAKGKFDEHKAVIGVKNQSEALAEYNSNYQPGWKGAASVVKFENAAEFKAWAESGATGEPVSQTAVRIRTPEGGKMHKPQIDEPHIVATAVRSGEKYLVGSKWNEAHEGIGVRHGIEMRRPSADRGFIVQDADGGQRFVSRKEAGPIAQKAGQNIGPVSSEGIQSGELKEAVTRAENKITNLAKGTMAKHRSTLATLGHDAAPRVGKTDNESGIQAKLNRQGVPMVTIDPKKLAKVTAGMDDRALSKYVQRAIEEEILHVGALRWELQAPENNVAIKEWGSEKDELDKFLSESYPGWEDLSERQKGHEKLRSVLQKRWTGKLTEAATRVIKAFLKYLRGIYEKLTPAQREIVDGVEALLKGNKAEMKPPAKATSQVPTGETKYVLPSFVTAPHVKAKPTKLDTRAEALEARLNDTTNKAPYIAASTDAAVIRTLLRSRTGVALDQAEKKIAKLEDKYAGEKPSTETVGVRSEGGSVGEKAPLRQPGETPGPSEEKPVGRAGSSTLDTQTQKELTDAFEGLFAGLPKNLSDKIGNAQVSEGDIEELRRHNLLRLGATPESAVKLGGSKEVGDEASAAIVRQMREGLGAGIPQLAIPAEKIGPFVTVAGKLVAQGVDTPQKLAAELETLFKGKANSFAQALWDMIGVAKPALRGTHDWSAIFQSLGEPSIVARAGVEPAGALADETAELAPAAEAGKRAPLAETEPGSKPVEEAERAPDASMRDLQLLADLPQRYPRLEKGFSSLDIEGQREVMAHVLGVVRENSQIFNAIVKRIPVDVMDDLTRGKNTAQSAFDDQAVFVNLLSSNGNPNVTGLVVDTVLRASRHALSESEQHTSGNQIYDTTTATTPRSQEPSSEPAIPSGQGELGERIETLGPNTDGRAGVPGTTNIGGTPEGSEGVTPELQPTDVKRHFDQSIERDTIGVRAIGVQIREGTRAEAIRGLAFNGERNEIVANHEAFTELANHPSIRDRAGFVTSSVSEELAHAADKHLNPNWPRNDLAALQAVDEATFNAVRDTYGHADDVFGVAMEYIRMLAQVRAGRPLTESFFRDTTEVEHLLAQPQASETEAAVAKMLDVLGWKQASELPSAQAPPTTVNLGGSAKGVVGVGGLDEIIENDTVRLSNGKSGTVLRINGQRITVSLAEGGTLMVKKHALRLERPFEPLQFAAGIGGPFKNEASDEQRRMTKERRGSHEDTRPPKERLTEWWNDFRHEASRNFEAGIFDSFAPIRQGSVDAWKAAHLTQELPSVIKHLLEHGQIKFDGTWFGPKEGTKGLLNELKEVLSHREKAELWELYAAAYRADRLLEEGREHNFGRVGDTWSKEAARAEINEALKLAEKYPEFETARQAYAGFNRSILDLAERTGLINAGQRLMFENEDYIPFYRMAEEVSKPGIKRTLANQRSKIRHLKGGGEKIAVLENIYRNLETMVDASYKNAAMLKIVDGFKDSELVTEEPSKHVKFTASIEEIKAKLADEGISVKGGELDDMLEFWRARAPKDPDVISVMRDGKPEYYRVHDPLLLRAVLDLGADQFGALVNVMGKFRGLLTNAVTLDPVFSATNFIRDTLAAWIQFDGKMTPGVSAAKGLMKAAREGKELQAIMAGGGGLGTYHRLSEKEIRKRFLAHGKKRSVLFEAPLDVARFVVRMQRASENANRIAVAESVAAAGGSTLDVAFAAKDTLNFTSRGGFTTVKLLVRVLPFFNARLQGLNKLGRSAGIGGGGRGAGGGPIGRGSIDGGGTRKTFAIRAGMMTVAALALAVLASDDDEYEGLEDWDRDTYFHFWIAGTHVRIPKPFELGFIFATIPERITQMFRTGDYKQLWNRFWAGLSEQLAFNPIPQMIRPGVESWANKNMFTGRPIVSETMRFQDPEKQFHPGTSETFKAIAQAVPDGAPEWMRSPVQLEHLFRGYFAALGMYTLGATDAVLSVTTDKPAKPGSATDRIPVVNTFLRRFLPDDQGRSSRFVGEFYELHKELTQTVKRIKDYETTGSYSEASEERSENAALLAREPAISAAYKDMAAARKEQKEVLASRTLSASQKKMRLETITEQINRAARAVVRNTSDDKAEIGRVMARAESRPSSSGSKKWRGKQAFGGF